MQSIVFPFRRQLSKRCLTLTGTDMPPVMPKEDVMAVARSCVNRKFGFDLYPSEVAAVHRVGGKDGKNIIVEFLYR